MALACALLLPGTAFGSALGSWTSVDGSGRPVPLAGAPDSSASAVASAVASREAEDLAWLQDVFTEVAADEGVPAPLLLALAWEATHFAPEVSSQWAGYGMFDLREPGEGGPDIEEAAVLLGLSPDEIIADPALQIEAAAALLSESARVAHDGALPDADDLPAWWTAVASFSGRHEPHLQDMFARYIFDVVRNGAARRGLVLDPRDLDLAALPDLPPPPSTCDYAGCYQFIGASSSNYSDYSRGASSISYVIVHTVQGSYSGCISWFQNSSAGVSAHYVVRSSDGQVTQMLREEDVGWHAGNWSYNEASVGIEHEGYVDDPGTWYTSAMYESSADLTSDILARNGIPVSRSYVIAHSEVPGATHTDPGSGWDWDTYMSLISGGETTGDLIGVVRDSDIYSGANLVGATVTLAETGETTTVDGEGYYRFYDLPLDSYTAVASMDGYADGSCAKDLSTGTNWCSIALEPGGDGGSDGGDGGDGGGDGGGDDGGADTGGLTGDTGTTDPGTGPGDDPDSPPGALGVRPGTAVPMDEVQGGCSATPAAAGLWLGMAALLSLSGRRRRS